MPRRRKTLTKAQEAERAQYLHVLDTLEQLCRFAHKQREEMDDDTQPQGAKVPTGDDWNDLHGAVMQAMAKLSKPN